MSASTAFFYGTLMHPKILKRVIKNDGSHLQICPAVLLDYTRHRVKDAEYPGIVPYARGRQLFDRELDQEERSVRGTIVRGLTLQDISHLDVFEGDEYERLAIQAHPLAPFTGLTSRDEFQGDATTDASSLIPPHAAPLPAITNLPDAVPAHTYVFQDLRFLEPVLWSFDDFVQRNAWKWYGGSPNGSEVDEEYSEGESPSEVEKRREAMIAAMSVPIEAGLLIPGYASERHASEIGNHLSL